MNADAQVEIAERAYFIWKQRGCPNGTELENWLKAESELTNEKVPEAAAAIAVAAPQEKPSQRKKRPAVRGGRSGAADAPALQ